MKTARHEYKVLVSKLLVLAVSVNSLHSEVPNKTDKQLPTTPVPGKTQKLTSPDQVPEGLSKTEWHSVRQAYEAFRHSFKPIEGSPDHYYASNPTQKFASTFDGRGFTTRIQDSMGHFWEWGLELNAYGLGQPNHCLKGKAPVKSTGKRLEYAWSNTLIEWWQNEANGLEHGYTLIERPLSGKNDTSTCLVLELATRGPLNPKVIDEGKSVTFQNDANQNVLIYSGLKCWDADKKELVCHFSLTEKGKGIRLTVEDRSARYPVTIDPTVHRALVTQGSSPDGVQTHIFHPASHLPKGQKTDSK